MPEQVTLALSQMPNKHALISSWATCHTYKAALARPASACQWPVVACSCWSDRKNGHAACGRSTNIRSGGVVDAVKAQLLRVAWQQSGYEQPGMARVDTESSRQILDNVFCARVGTWPHMCSQTMQTKRKHALLHSVQHSAVCLANTPVKVLATSMCMYWQCSRARNPSIGSASEAKFASLANLPDHHQKHACKHTRVTLCHQKQMARQGSKLLMVQPPAFTCLQV